jgi:hypothetical protein
MDFHLGDRVHWISEKRSGIIIDLLDYEGESAGTIGVLMDDAREVKSIRACECRTYTPTPTKWEDELEDYGDGCYGWPRSDCY